jgi:hypothetical protein
LYRAHNFSALKVVKSAVDYTESALDEIRMLKSVSMSPNSYTYYIPHTSYILILIIFNILYTTEIIICYLTFLGHFPTFLVIFIDFTLVHFLLFFVNCHYTDNLLKTLKLPRTKIITYPILFHRLQSSLSYCSEYYST